MANGANPAVQSVVVMADHFQSLGRAIDDLKALLERAYSPQIAYGNSQAAPLRVALDMRGVLGRLHLEVWVKSSGAADFLVEASRNGVDWREIGTIFLLAAGEKHQGYANAYPVVRVRTDAVGDHEIEIVAAR